ncbi:Uncharacterised protein [uncultured archaeon]|nr:Uncharacterised protein [uncultured archaeon]
MFWLNTAPTPQHTCMRCATGYDHLFPGPYCPLCLKIVKREIAARKKKPVYDYTVWIESVDLPEEIKQQYRRMLSYKK